MLLTLCITASAMQVFAQHKAGIQPLQIGQKVPDLKLERIINADFSFANLSAYRGKVVILDFWGLTCVPCVAALPEYELLQKKYGDWLQIIPVTKDSQDKVQAFLNKRWPGDKKLSMPFLTQDTLLGKYFPHISIPHEVWIGPDGEVIAITSGQFVVEKYIEQAINRQKLDLPVKDDSQYSLDFDLFDNLPLIKKHNQKHSYIGEYIEGIAWLSGSGFSKRDKNRFRIRAYNFPIVNLFVQAFDFTGNQKKQIIFENIKDSSRYIKTEFRNEPLKEQEWIKKNHYTYQLEFNADSGVKTEIKKKGLAMMAGELNNFFEDKYGLTVAKEKRLMPCLVLIRISDDSKYRSKTKKTENYTTEKDHFYMHYNINTIAELLNLHQSKLVVDGTYYDGMVDLKIPLPVLKDTVLLKKALNSYGLDLVEDEREMEVLVFRENGTK